MKMYYHLTQISTIIILVLLVARQSFAQKYEMYEDFDKSCGYYNYPYPFMSNGTYYVACQKGQVISVKPDVKMEKSEFPLLDKEEVQCGGSVDFKPCLFLKRWGMTKGKKEEVFYATFYNQSDTKTQEAKKLFKIDYTKLKYPNNTLRSESSDDESKFLIYYNAPYEKKGNFKLGLFVGNNKFEKLIHKELELPFEAQDKPIYKFKIDIKLLNNGTVYFLIQYEIDPTSGDFASKKRWNSKYSLVKITTDGKITKLNDIKLSNQELSISSARLNYDKNTDQVDLIGTAISMETLEPIFYKYKLGDDNFKEEEYIKFPEIIIKELTTVDKPIPAAFNFDENDSNMPIWTYRLKNIIPQENNDLILFVEQSTKRGSHHIYGKILTLKLSPKNNIKWSTLINQKKKLYIESYYYIDPEYAVTQTDNSIYIVYNTEFDLEPNAYAGTEKDKLDRMTFVSINPETGEKINNKSIYIKKPSAGFLPTIKVTTPNNLLFLIDDYGRVKLE